jgi:hypothetical protein
MVTRRADSSGFEGVPEMATVTSPEIVLAGRPTAERAPDARAGRVEPLLLIQNNGRFGRVTREGAHVPVLCPNLVRRFSAGRS